jgi:acetyl esterase/lipase
MQSTTTISSLEQPILQVARFSLRYLSLSVINSLGLVLRKLLKWNLQSNGKFSIKAASFNSNIDVIEYKPDSSRQLSKDCIVYINGGGFSLCDSADVLLSERLLPYLAQNSSFLPPVIYCIHYPTLQNTDNITNYEIVKQQIYDSYVSIVQNSNKDIKCIIGDSAGGNLVLNLLAQLETCPPKTVLISPWLNLFSNAESYIRNQNDDLLCPRWLDRSRDAYLGKTLSNFIDDQVKKYQADLYAEHIVQNTNVKVVVFDMDQTIARKHSRGSLPRMFANSFISSISPDFCFFARSLHNCGIKLAVATHSDSFEYNFIKSQDAFIIGDELVKLVLETAVPDLASYFHIIAYNPAIRKDGHHIDNQNKRLHMRLISQHYQVKREECLLFDDDEGNVINNSGFKAVLVDWKTGFKFNDVESFLSSYNGLRYDNELLKRLPSVVSDINPLLLTDEQIQKLKVNEVMIQYGEKELFYDDIKLFIHRFKKLGKSMEVVIGNDIHAYPILWQHPLAKISLAIGFGFTLFEFFLPHRRNQPSQGDEAICKMSEFIRS